MPTRHREIRVRQRGSRTHRHNRKVGIMMRREPPPNNGRERVSAHLAAYRGRRPRPSTRWAVDHAEQRADRQLDPPRKPWSDMIAPRPRVQSDFSRLLPLPARTRIEPRRGSRSDSISDKASWIRSPPRQSTTISARSLSPCPSAGVWRITATISSTVGGSAG